MKTSELTGAALDWAVAKITNPEWWEDGYMENDPMAALDMDDGTAYSPSINWAQGGPIIEREGINIERVNNHGKWEAWTPAPERRSGEAVEQGPTPLMAAMRCYVASKFGTEVDVPEELCQ